MQCESVIITVIVSDTKTHKELALALVANEADVNAKNKNDMTPLLYACEKGHKEVALALVANGADVNARDEEVVTQLLAFHSGAELWRAKMAKQTRRCRCLASKASKAST